MGPKIPKPNVPAGLRPITPTPKAAPRPTTTIPAKRRWSFSFRYWNQIEYFGFGKLSDVSDNWFVSFLERLREMCALAVDDVLEYQEVQEGLRFHAIDPKDERTTMRREDFTWLDATYRDDAENYEFFQFHVSKALGRVVGFFDENAVFNVLLLDPRHNMQLSKFNGYQKRHCKVLESEHGILRASIDKALTHMSSADHERARSTLVKATIDRTGPDGEARAVITIDEKDAAHVEDLLIKSRASLRDIFEAGLLQFLDRADKILTDLAEETDNTDEH